MSASWRAIALFAALTLTVLVGLLAGAGSLAAPVVRVENVRTWPAPDHTRIVFDTTGPVEHTLFTLHDPERVVVDVRGAALAQPIKRPDRDDRLLAGVRSAPRGNGNLRVVFDLKQAVRPKSFLLRPGGNYGYRLVIDLLPRDAPVAAASRSASTPAAANAAVAKPRDIIVAIDAGHGGDDPGATGPAGTREKDVTLQIARQLQRLLDLERGMQGVLVRDGDYYLGLRRRMEVARGHRADLFVSVHADAFRDPRVRGTSVYVLSRNGASSEAARWLAEQENAADLVGGVSLDDKDELLASVLLDLSQTATMSASTEVGSRILGELRKVGKTHKRRVERAGFMVLKSPDIPSILVETAFITNPQEERKLRNPAHQRALARAILNGVRAYFRRNPPPGSLYAERRHTIERGETLAGIAQRYRVSLDKLRDANGLRGDAINEGEVLNIPAPLDS